MMNESSNMKPETYLKGLRGQFPDIKPNDVDDWDWTWGDEGYQFLEACDFGMAELTFQRLIASRPQNPDGFEGLAMVYKALGIRSQAAILIDEAVTLAEAKLAAGHLDAEVVDEIKSAQKQIHDMPAVPRPPVSTGDDDDDPDADDKEDLCIFE